MKDNICYRIILNILDNIPQYIFIFLGQQHLALLRFRVDGSGIGALAGGELPDLPPEGQRPQDLGSLSVSIIQDDTVQNTTVLPYFAYTINSVFST